MNSKDRCLMVLSGGIPDRVPVALHNFLPAAYMNHSPMGLVLQDGNLLAESQIQAWREFGHDMLLVENGVVAEAGACGCELEFYDNAPPRVSKHVLGTGLDGIDQLQVPDPYTTFPMCEVLRAVKILVDCIGDKVFIMGRSDQGPGALAMALRGYEQFILDLAQNDQPELISKLMDYCVKVQVRYAQALRETGAHGTAIGGLGLSLLSPALYRNLEQPMERRVLKEIIRGDYPAALHICGNASLILDDMVSTGASILELDYLTDLTKAKQKVDNRAVILGPVNPEVIRNADDPVEIQLAARDAINILAPGGGFILGAGCAIAHDTPLENIHALVDSARIYGRYANDGSLMK